MFVKNFILIFCLIFFSEVCSQNLDSEDALLQAREAFEAEDLHKLSKVKSLTNNEELKRWLDFWHLRILINQKQASKETDQRLKTFLELNSFHPLKERITDIWVESLIELSNETNIDYLKKKISSTFPKLQNQSAECFLAARSGITLEETRRLIYGNESIVGCVKLLLFTIKEKKTTPEFIVYNARHAANAGKLNVALLILKTGRSFLSKKSYQSEVRLAKIIALSKKNSRRAYKRFIKGQKFLNDEQRDYGAIQIGSALFGVTHSKYRNLIKNRLKNIKNYPDDIIETLARIALRDGDFNTLAFIIEKMSANLSKKDSWQYWKAVTMTEKGLTIQSYKIFDQLRKNWSFYGILAREKLGYLSKPKFDKVTTAIDYSYEKKINSQRFKLVMLFYKQKLYKEALLEWNDMLKNFNDTELINFSRFLRREKVYDRSISAALKTKHFHDYSLRYPVPYQKVIVAESKTHSIPPWLTMGLIRQESRFNSSAISNSGARGLMQIMPATGKSISKQLKLGYSKKNDLLALDVNVSMGSYYVKKLMARFQSFPIAIAAYNAGPSRAKVWKNDSSSSLSGAAFTESIPFDETRNYVKTVLSSAIIYSRIYDDAPPFGLRTNKHSFVILNELLGILN